MGQNCGSSTCRIAISMAMNPHLTPQFHPNMHRTRLYIAIIIIFIAYSTCILLYFYNYRMMPTKSALSCSLNWKILLFMHKSSLHCLLFMIHSHTHSKLFYYCNNKSMHISFSSLHTNTIQDGSTMNLL